MLKVEPPLQTAYDHIEMAIRVSKAFLAKLDNQLIKFIDIGDAEELKGLRAAYKRMYGELNSYQRRKLLDSPRELSKFIMRIFDAKEVIPSLIRAIISFMPSLDDPTPLQMMTRDLLFDFLSTNSSGELLRNGPAKFYSTILAFATKHTPGSPLLNRLRQISEEMQTIMDMQESEPTMAVSREGFTPLQVYEDVYSSGIPKVCVEVLRRRIREYISRGVPTPANYKEELSAIIRDDEVMSTLLRIGRMDMAAANMKTVSEAMPYMYNALSARYTAERWFSMQKRVLRPSTKWMAEISDAEIRVPLKYIEAPFETVYIDFGRIGHKTRIEGFEPKTGYVVGAFVMFQHNSVEQERRALNIILIYSKSMSGYLSIPIKAEDEEMFPDSATIAKHLVNGLHHTPPSEYIKVVNTIFNLFLYMSHVKEDVIHEPVEQVDVPLKVHSEKGQRRQQRLQQRAYNQIDLFVIGQNIIVRDQNNNVDQSGDGVHGYVRPHWRRGHWRVQWHGSVRWGNRKAVPTFIREVLVHKSWVKQGSPTEMGTYAVEEADNKQQERELDGRVVGP